MKLRILLLCVCLALPACNREAPQVAQSAKTSLPQQVAPPVDTSTPIETQSMNNYPSVLADDDSWINAERTEGGQPRMVRIRPDLASFDGKTSFPRKIVFTWTYGDDPELSGLPNEAQYNQMRPFEDALVLALEKSRAAIFVYARTGLGLREWNFYIVDIEGIQPDLNRVLSHFPGLPLTIGHYEDKHWSEYSAIVDRMQ